MTTPFDQVALEMRDKSGKHLIFTTNDLEVIAGRLRGTAGGAKTRGATGGRGANRRGGARRNGPAKSKASVSNLPFTGRFIDESFKLMPKADGSQLLCRKLKRGGAMGSFPVIAIEALEARLEEEHKLLGHPGYEQLYNHVSNQGSDTDSPGPV